MNFYQPFGRWYVQFDWAEPSHGFRLAIGRWPKGQTLAKLDAYRARMADEYAADDVPHPYSDPDALQGHITTPVGAQSFEAIKEAHEDAPQAIGAQSSYVIDVTKGPYVPNPPSNWDPS